MSDSIKPAGRRAPPLVAERDSPLPEETASHRPRNPESAASSSDSWWPHLWYGLGAVAFVVPFFIPGVPHRTLFAVYLGIGVVLMIAPFAWGVVRSVRDAHRARRRRRRSLM